MKHFRISQNEEKKNSNEQSIGMPYFNSDNSREKHQLTTHSAVCVIFIRICANIVRKKNEKQKQHTEIKRWKIECKTFRIHTLQRMHTSTNMSDECVASEK